jgi:hypothetical protein
MKQDKAFEIPKTLEELAKLAKPSGIIGSNGQKRKMSLFKSDKVESSKTRKSSANEQVT